MHAMPNINCCLCDSPEHELFFPAHDHISGENFRVVRCKTCSLIFVNPQPSLDQLGRYYPATHQVSKPAAYERMDARPRIRDVKNLLPGKPGKILDIGCGKGLFLAGLKDLGWQAVGVEMSETSGQYARTLDLDICSRSLENCAFERESFDVITLFHSLEHMHNPIQTLQHIYTLLRPGGCLLIEVPNAGSWYARAFGENWFHCDVPRHLFHFSRGTLTKAIDLTGFRLNKLTTINVQYDAFGAVQSLLNVVLARKNLLNDFNTGETDLTSLLHSKHKWRDLAGLALSEIGLVFGFPLFALTDLALQPWVEGGTLRVIAVK
jgi:SAM-dependent methyltransferase